MFENWFTLDYSSRRLEGSMFGSMFEIDIAIGIYICQVRFYIFKYADKLFVFIRFGGIHHHYHLGQCYRGSN
jgi:hypothetical protein